MRNSIQFSDNKTLKLTNVLIRYMNLDEAEDWDSIVVQMENYVKSKGALPVGPLIQKTVYEVTDEGELTVKIFLMRQANNYIHNTESPYKMESIIRVKNCMYARYTGPEEKIKFAYDKINLNAFENDITLSDENYTIFVSQEEDILIADVFVEKVGND